MLRLWPMPCVCFLVVKVDDVSVLPWGNFVWFDYGIRWGLCPAVGLFGGGVVFVVMGGICRYAPDWFGVKRGMDWLIGVLLRRVGLTFVFVCEVGCVMNEGEFANFLNGLREMFEERIPFNKVLGLKIEEMAVEPIRIGFVMRPDLVGNPLKGILHGGVIAAVLDVVGGLAALHGTAMRHEVLSPELVGKVMSRMGTIDLRVDYLRPGRGEAFVASARVMRAGRTVAVTRMELHNEVGTLVSVGVGSYVVG